MIYKDGKKLIPFKGDYAPVNVYKGSVKIAGWEYSEVSGESLAVENTYNDSVGIRINGKTIEVGEGDKSPANPYILESISNFDLIGTDGTHTQTINYPYTLRSLPDGTRDYIEIDNIAKTAKLTRNVGVVELNENFTYGSYIYNSPLDNYTYHFYVRKVSCMQFSSAISTRFTKTGGYQMTPVDENILTTWYSYNGVTGTLYGQISKLLIDPCSGTSVDEKIKNYFTVNPTVFQYQLATPTITDLDYNAVLTYYPYTNIYTNATVQPTLDGKFRIIGG